MENQGTNPYQAPQAPVADISSGPAAVKLTLKQIFFSFEGRVSRKVFWLYLLAAFVPMAVIYGIAAAISDTLGMIVGIPLYIVFIWVSIAIQVKRWHDRNKSGWWVLLGLVPIGNIWAFIETGFLRGTVGANNFGADATDLY